MGHDSRKSLVSRIISLGGSQKKSGKETKRAVAAGRTRGFCEELVCSFAEDLALSAERRGGLGLGGRIVEHGKRKREQEQGFEKSRHMRRV